MARGPTWQRTLGERGWSDQFLPAGEFHRFIESEQARVAGVAASLRGSGGAQVSSGTPVSRARHRGRASARRSAGRVTRPRRHAGRGKSRHRALSLVVLALLAYLAAARIRGFIVASALLFWIVAIAFDGRHRRRDLAIAVMFSIAVYVVFTRGLNLPCLPAGRTSGPARGRLMDALARLADGFAVALTAENLLWAARRCHARHAVGVLPGIGPAVTIALLLPVTYSLDPVAAFIMFAGIYYGAMYGGSTTAILLNTPGETGSMMSAIEGHAMARAGRGGAALATAAIGSFVAGTLATARSRSPRRRSSSWRCASGRPNISRWRCRLRRRLGQLAARRFVDSRACSSASYRLDRHRSADRRASFHVRDSAIADGIDAVVVVIGLFAVAEVLDAPRTPTQPRGVPAGLARRRG